MHCTVLDEKLRGSGVPQVEVSRDLKNTMLLQKSTPASS